MTKQKPYISRAGRDWTVLDSRGRPQLVTQSRAEAGRFWSVNFDALSDDSLPIKD